jgi:hypothetical protein
MAALLRGLFNLRLRGEPYRKHPQSRFDNPRLDKTRPPGPPHLEHRLTCTEAEIATNSFRHNLLREQRLFASSHRIY